MFKASRKEAAGVIAVIVVFGLALTGLIVKSMRAATEPGITLRETFAQPPGGPLPGRPAADSIPTNTPSSSGVNVSSSPQSTSSTASPSAASTSAISPTDAGPSPNREGANAGNASTPANSTNEIVVHVAGAVKKPGVYHLPAGSRNDDAIQKAGGPTAEANTDGLNLASRVEDGSQLYLPTRKQHPEGGADAPTTTSTSAPISAVSSPATKTSGKSASKTAAQSGAKTAGGAKGGKGGKLSDPAQGTVNINTASAEELQRIPGIGPAMAERILDFRKQNGKFTAPEDMLQISGIGEKKFAKMQPFVRIR